MCEWVKIKHYSTRLISPTAWRILWNIWGIKLTESIIEKLSPLWLQTLNYNFQCQLISKQFSQFIKFKLKCKKPTAISQMPQCQRHLQLACFVWPSVQNPNILNVYYTSHKLSYSRSCSQQMLKRTAYIIRIAAHTFSIDWLIIVALKSINIIAI